MVKKIIFLAILFSFTVSPQVAIADDEVTPNPYGDQSSTREQVVNGESKLKQLTPELKTLLGLYFSNLVYHLNEKGTVGIVGTKEAIGYLNQLSAEEREMALTQGPSNLKHLEDFKAEAISEETGEGIAHPSVPLEPFLNEYGDDLSLKNWVMFAIRGNTGIATGVTYLKEETSGVIAYHPMRKILVVATRGTVGGLDWLTNASPTGLPVKDVHTFAALVPTNGRVPRGFLGYARSMARQFYEAMKVIVNNEDEEETQIIVTGHSLGAAAATVNAAWLASMAKITDMMVDVMGSKVGREYLSDYLYSIGFTDKPDNIPQFKPQNISLITFGMPGNVGNKPFVNWLDEKLEHMVLYYTEGDPVTKITTSYVPSIWGLFDSYISGVSENWEKTGTGPFFEPASVDVKFHKLTTYGRAILYGDQFTEMTKRVVERVQQGLQKVRSDLTPKSYQRELQVIPQTTQTPQRQTPPLEQKKITIDDVRRGVEEGLRNNPETLPEKKKFDIDEVNKGIKRDLWKRTVPRDTVKSAPAA